MKTQLASWHMPQMLRTTGQQVQGRDHWWQPVFSPHPSAGRKMRVYQREEGPGSPEAQAVFLEPGQTSQQALSTEEPRPLELSGTTRVGLEGPERRRFSASELMTRLHSSLRLGRSSAARALAASGTGAAREGKASSWAHRIHMPNEGEGIGRTGPLTLGAGQQESGAHVGATPGTMRPPF